VTRRRLSLLAPAVTGVALLAAACTSGAPAGPSRTPRPLAPHGGRPTGTSARRAAPPADRRGVRLNMLVITDGTPPVQAIRRQLSVEGVPATVVNLRDPGRPRITSAFLIRGRGSARSGNFDGIVLPGATPRGQVPRGLTPAEKAALATYERTFGVRQVDAYVPPTAAAGMSAPTYSGPMRGSVTVTGAGARAGFGYLNRSFPFHGGAAGPAPFGYLAQPLPGESGTVTPLLTAALPHLTSSGTFVWQYDHGGRQQLEVSFGYSYYLAQFRYLAPGIVDWLTRGVFLGYWRSYLNIGYDDVINADSRWSTVGHCSPGDSACPPGTPKTGTIRMTPADVRYAVRWQQRHHFVMEFLYNGGASARFRVHGTDPLTAAFRPVARDFRWVNHTYTHANLGCKQDFSVVPWRCVKSDGQVVWASTSLINSQIADNLTWARRNGIPVEPGVLATGEYSGLQILPQQPADNPNLVRALGPDKIRWIAADASRDPDMRRVGPALSVPRHPIDVGYDVASVADEINEYSWYNTAKRDGGSGRCESSTVTKCIEPLNPKTGWASFILPRQVKIIFAAVLSNDPRPFFMHQSNLTGDRLGYSVMDRVLSDYRAVYRASAPLANLPMSGDGTALHQQALWAGAMRAGTVQAYVRGRTITITGPPGTLVPVTAPAGTRVGQAAGPAFGRPYDGLLSGYAMLGSQPFRLELDVAPYRP
ncbi:MAG: hypothetical protein ACRDRJ_27595, partial [Streptosporangiaceae bacterium]